MKVLIKLAIGALLLTLKPNNKPMGTSFIPFSAIIAVLARLLPILAVTRRSLVTAIGLQFAVAMVLMTTLLQQFSV